jgi:hypothetical protein
MFFCVCTQMRITGIIMIQNFMEFYWILAYFTNFMDLRQFCECTENTASSSPPIVTFEVLTAVVMKSTIFWDITPCSTMSVDRRFGGTYRLHLQGQKISWARNQRESRWQAVLLLLRPRDWCEPLPSNGCLQRRSLANAVFLAPLFRLSDVMPQYCLHWILCCLWLYIVTD